MQIHYDASTIGARDLFNYYRSLDPSLKLTPPSSSCPSRIELARMFGFSWLMVLLFTVAVLILAWTRWSPAKPASIHISLGLATAVQLLALHEFASNSVKTLLHNRGLDMDALIALGTSMAYALSVVSYVYDLKGESLDSVLNFEAFTLLVLFLLTARVLNAAVHNTIAKSVSFRCPQTNEVLLVKLDPNAPMDPDPKIRKIDSRLLQYGDRFKVLPRAMIVTDGVVICGGSEVNEYKITAERIPVAKSVQSLVYAGTKNGSGALIVGLTALLHENTVQKLAGMIEDVQPTRPIIATLTERTAKWCVPIIAVLSLATFLIWLFVQRSAQQSWTNAVIHAITYTLATIIVCSPSAINIATRTTISVARTAAVRHGIHFRSPRALDLARLVTDVVFEDVSRGAVTQPTDACRRPDHLASRLLDRSIAVHTHRSHSTSTYIQDLQRRRGSVVLYVGDDASALRQADIGVTRSSANEAARQVADVVVLSQAQTTLDILAIIDFSHKVHRRIVTALAWAAVFNVLAVLLAAGAFTGLRVQVPWVGLSSCVGVLPVFFVAYSVNWVGWK
ncbi:hypothetical protein NX059_007833 [Plenodomus lindquistii]|nr:hypothetical protein NX059_007833 [Plenodomus lindquistii]